MPGLAAGADDRDGTGVGPGEGVGGERAGRGGAGLGQEAVVEQHRGHGPGGRVEDGDQAAGGGQALSGVAREAAGDLHGQEPVTVDVRALDVDLTTGGRDAEMPGRRAGDRTAVVSDQRRAGACHGVTRVQQCTNLIEPQYQHGSSLSSVEHR